MLSLSGLLLSASYLSILAFIPQNICTWEIAMLSRTLFNFLVTQIIHLALEIMITTLTTLKRLLN